MTRPGITFEDKNRCQTKRVEEVAKNWNEQNQQREFPISDGYLKMTSKRAVGLRQNRVLSVTVIRVYSKRRTAGVGQSFVPENEFMRCHDFQQKLALYDELTDETTKNLLDSHLSMCPVCRSRAEDFKNLRGELSNWKRIEIPNVVVANLRHAVLNELAVGSRQSQIFSNQSREWLQFRLMPYAVGTVATFALVMLLLVTLTKSRLSSDYDLAFSEAQSSEGAVLIATNRAPDFSAMEISQREFASTRSQFASESPSLNPAGTLLVVTSSLMRGRMRNREVVFVADVLSDGMARVTEMVEPSAESEDAIAIENALQTDLAAAPFVPARIDGRSDVVRVVLKINRVDIRPAKRPSR